MKKEQNKRCDCKSCKFKGMALCDYKKCLDAVSELRVALMIANQVMGDIATSIKSDGDRQLLIDAARINANALGETNKLFEGLLR